MIYQLQYNDYRTYKYVTLFVLGNIIVPQLCHLVPQGGLILLPIYFFTLIAAYKYGIVAGLLTAILSPIVNHLMFDMPALHVLPILLIKGSVLALLASYIAKQTGRVTLLAVIGAVVGYQLVGGMFEWAMTGSLMAALQDLRIGYPGMMMQIMGGYIIMKRFANNG